LIRACNDAQTEFGALRHIVHTRVSGDVYVREAISTSAKYMSVSEPE